MNSFNGRTYTLEETLTDIGAESPEQARELILQRLRQLHAHASRNGTLENFGTPYDFVVCDSTDLFRTLVEVGYGNMGMVFIDDYSPETYFFMFADKTPERFRPVVAKHEAIEYDLVTNVRVSQSEAHLLAERAELALAEEMGLKSDYLDFLRTEFPGKYKDIKSREK